MAKVARTPLGRRIKCVCDCGRCTNAEGAFNHCSACPIGRWRDSMVSRSEYTNAHQMWVLIRDRSLLMKRRFAVLFSHASELVYPDLVTDVKFDHRIDAHTYGQRVARVQGVEYEVMEDIDGEWRSIKGETCQQVIERRWVA